jgi:hypothetical protein
MLFFDILNRQFPVSLILIEKAHRFGYKFEQPIPDPAIPIGLERFSNYGIESGSHLIFVLLQIIHILSTSA